MTPQNPELASYLGDAYTAGSLKRLRSLLDERGTLTIPVLPSGLFSAATVTDFSKQTQYHAAWVRDNVHVAHAHAVNGQVDRAVAAARGLARFFATQHPRFDAIIADPSRRAVPQDRPHVRFNGDDLTEVAEDWSHAQNDALGYFVWLYAGLAADGRLTPSAAELETLSRFPRFFQAIEYWHDADSGHWEEAIKVEASSIGAVVAGLRQIRRWKAGDLSHSLDPIFPGSLLDDLLKQGEDALRRILPNETLPDGATAGRPCDAALLFLIYPLAVVDADMADQIIRGTEEHLVGVVGIRRYPGDSFYCDDYESHMASLGDRPTRDFSQDMQTRDALLTPGHEAQWCLFDPILSVYHGKRYVETGSTHALEKQTEYLNRSLCQITRADPPRCEAFCCPELYYHEKGRLQTSRATPLLWTQANLWTALEQMRHSLGERPGSERFLHG